MGNKTSLDCLDNYEFIVARSELTNEEKLCKDIGRTHYEKTEKSIRNIITHKINRRLSKWIFRYRDIGSVSLDFSKKVTGMYSQYRFLHLYRLIKRIKPKIVFEYGSGASTVFIAECLRLNDYLYGIKGKLISFEQSEKWSELIANNFPHELLEYVELNLKHVRLENFSQKYRGLYYENDYYPKEIDLMYIDGPTATRGNKESEDALQFWLCADIVKMVNNGVTIKYAVTDHRHVNFIFYKKCLTEYNISFSRYWRSIIIKKSSK